MSSIAVSLVKSLPLVASNVRAVDPRFAGMSKVALFQVEP